MCTQAISDVIELMLNELWINYSEIPADVQKQWFEKWVEVFTWPEEHKEQIRKPYNYRARRCYQQIMRDVRGGELQRLKWLSETLRRQLLNKFVNDPNFKKHFAVNKVNWASSKGGCLHTRGSATIPHARMIIQYRLLTRSLDRPPTDPELFREMHTRKHHRFVVEKRVDDLLTLSHFILDMLFSSRSSFLPTSSKPPNRRRKRVMRVLAQLTRTLCGVETQEQVMQQQIDEVWSLKETLAQRDARVKESLRHMEEMQRKIAAFYNPLCPGSSTAHSGSSTAPPLPLRMPGERPDHPPADDVTTTRMCS
ncbi:hypothetical protein PIB30_090129 [Stylosanthes scabra]|uniref:Uncharacterized protein n=1 Tax=Stylosanthes scabra TaxID=79078 RepID=A0ABU6QUU6_9FABA|nr:hypothetical protein [Stylosanthes scabra]